MSIKVKKPWGSFIQYTHNKKSTVKILEVEPGGVLSLQSHKKRDELWVLLEGEPTMILGEKKIRPKIGEEIMINRGTKHRIINNTKKTSKILEISFGHFDEEDIVRYEDKYGRA